MSIEYVDKLVLFSIKKKNLLESLLEKTKKQSEIIEKNLNAELEAILSEKDEIMKEIDGFDLEYLNVYEKLKKSENIKEFSQIDVSKYKNLKTLKEVTIDISKLLLEIENIDKENIKSFQANFDDVKSELKNVKTVQNAYKGYGTIDAGSMLIDERK